MREKLIEFIRQADKEDYESRTQDEHYAFMADSLIANGVTIQKWIPVSERLPEPFVSVLVQMPGEKPFPTVREGFISKDGIWHSALYDREPDEVTHWMPMPEPPKEE